MRQNSFGFIVILAVTAVFGATSWAKPVPSSASRLIVVESVPIETTLAVPGVASTQSTWLDMINGAKKTLDLEEFYISNQAGSSLAPVIDAIVRAANRGVKVRLLADAKFFKLYPQTVRRIGNLPHASAKTVDFSRYGGVQHSKYFVVDGYLAFVGSQNFDWRAITHIHEVGLEVNDVKVARQLERIFAKDWAAGQTVASSSTAMPAKVVPQAPMPVPTDLSHKAYYLTASPQVANPRGIPNTLSQISNLIRNAKQSVWVQVMEYSTHVYGNRTERWRVLDDLFRQAAGRGVKVHLMVDISDEKHAMDDLSSLARVPGITVEVVKIPQWSGGPIPYARLIHSKYMVVDGKTAWVGSENWTKGYFMSTRNVGLVVRVTHVVNQLSEIFTRVWTSSYATVLK